MAGSVAKRTRGMVIRVLPAKKGGVYSNTGSSKFLVNYLEHEAREARQEDKAIFFNQDREGITADEVQARINSNVQGLQKGKPHFHSLVISPSQDELRHLNNDPEKLKAYTRQVMDNYAANFTDKRQRSLKSDDLVWFATIHNSRHYSGLDDAVQIGTAQPRQQKEGEQTHIHVIVSARDKTMSRSLHPDAGSRRFNYKDWLHKNYQDFERTFDYKQIKTDDQHQQRLDKQVDRINRSGLSLDPEQMATIGRHYRYSSEFWKGINRVEWGVKQGNIFTANQAYEKLKATVEPKAKAPRPVSRQRAVQSYVPTNHNLPVHVPGKGKETVRTATPLATSSREVVQEAPTLKKLGITINPADPSAQPQQSAKRSRTDLSPLLNVLKFESVPETGEHARAQDDDYRRKLKRRR